MAKNYIVSGDDLTNVANAIRETAEISEPLTWPTEYIAKIRGIGADQESVHDAADRAEAAATEAAGFATQAGNSATASASSASQASASAQSAEGYADDSEAYAVGTRDGADVPSTDPTYQNNSKYYSEQSLASALRAETAAESLDITVAGKRLVIGTAV